MLAHVELVSEGGGDDATGLLPKTNEAGCSKLTDYKGEGRFERTACWQA